MKRKTYKKKYSGILIEGTVEVAEPDDYERMEHMHRAFYLTALLEAPHWGSVQSYDGCGMSGGPMHWIAAPKKGAQQGPLFELIARIRNNENARELDDEFDALDMLETALLSEGLKISRDGHLQDVKTGKDLSASRVRELFTPGRGKPSTAAQWEQAERWGRLFYCVLCDRRTFLAQKEHSIEYLIEGAASTEIVAYRYFKPKLETPEYLTVDDPEVKLRGDFSNDIPLPVDFAMCVYHSFTPNAPSMARKVLKSFFTAYDTWLKKQTSSSIVPVEGHMPGWAKLVRKHDPHGEVFAKTLIRKLGKTQYGNWHDLPHHNSRSRYDRCRNYAKDSGLWPSDYFEELMPKNLK